MITSRDTIGCTSSHSLPCTQHFLKCKDQLQLARIFVSCEQSVIDRSYEHVLPQCFTPMLYMLPVRSSLHWATFKIRQAFKSAFATHRCMPVGCCRATTDQVKAVHQSKHLNFLHYCCPQSCTCCTHTADEDTMSGMPAIISSLSYSAPTATLAAGTTSGSVALWRGPHPDTPPQHTPTSPMQHVDTDPSLPWVPQRSMAVSGRVDRVVWSRDSRLQFTLDFVHGLTAAGSGDLVNWESQSDPCDISLLNQKLCLY